MLLLSDQISCIPTVYNFTYLSDQLQSSIQPAGMKIRKLDNVDTDIDALSFFADYISKRQPVIIRGLPDDAAFKAHNWVSAR